MKPRHTCAQAHRAAAIPHGSCPPVAGKGGPDSKMPRTHSVVRHEVSWTREGGLGGSLADHRALPSGWRIYPEALLPLRQPPGKADEPGRFLSPLPSLRVRAAIKCKADRRCQISHCPGQRTEVLPFRFLSTDSGGWLGSANAGISPKDTNLGRLH